MKNFEEVRFPTDISYGSSGGPEYSTDVVSTVSGHEYRNINWSYGRMKYNVSQGIRSESQLQKLLRFFRARKGKAIGFRFKDWSDYKVENQLIAIGDGVKNEFQLIKSYKSGGFIEERIILKPVYNTLKIYLDKREVNKDEFNIDYKQGLIKFNNSPSENQEVTSDFEFDVPVRFDIDYLPFRIESYGVYSCNNVCLIEIKPQN